MSKGAALVVKLSPVSRPHRHPPASTGLRGLLGTPAGRAVAALNAAIAVAVVVGMVALWPSGAAPAAGAVPTATDAERAVVTGVSAGGCEAYAGPNCRVVDFELRSGPRQGEASFLALADELFAPDVDPGDEIRVVANTAEDVPGATDGTDTGTPPPAAPYSFDDFERGAPLAWLALGFTVLVIALGRWQGVRTLVGLGAGLLVVLAFVVPAILAGGPPLLVSLVGGMAVVMAATALTHGLGYKSAAAVLGMAGALVLTGLLAVAAVRLAHVTGFSSEESRLLLAGSTSGLSLSGVVVAGMLIGALGVLDDVTVSQSSTVLALRRANPALGFGRLMREGLQVGRDHLGATINTLVLAYAGAGLPVLLIFGTEGVGLGQAIRQEEVAQEVVAMLVGSAGLVAAMPLTTALAAMLAVRVPPGALPDEPHAHAH